MAAQQQQPGILEDPPNQPQNGDGQLPQNDQLHQPVVLEIAEPENKRKLMEFSCGCCSRTCCALLEQKDLEEESKIDLDEDMLHPFGQENETIETLREGYNSHGGRYESKFCKHFMIVFVATIIPTAGIFYLFTEHLTYLQNFVVSTYFIFIVFMILCGTLLLEWTTEDSLSGMVAQRYNFVSYITILLLTGVAFYTSCFILCGSITSQKQGENPNVAIVILATMSPIVSFCILISPLVVKNNAVGLGFVPLNTELINGGYILFWAPVCLKRMKRNTAYTFQTFFHYFFVAFGVIMGYVAVVFHIQTGEKWTNQLVLLALGLCVSGCFMFTFIIISVIGIQYRNIHSKRSRLYIEFLGLYYYMVLMVMLGVIAGGLLPDAL